MKAVVQGLQPLLKAAGFRKRGHTFNRSPEPGLVQVVNFQMGSFNPPGPNAAANVAAREELFGVGDLYGRFTINLGVYVEEMVMQEWERPRDWVSEPTCQLRMRIGDLLDPPGDRWWSLEDVSVAHAAADEALDRAGLPWLNRLSSREHIVDAYERYGSRGVGVAGAFRIAWLLRDADPERAEALLLEHLNGDNNRQHREWLTQRLVEAGLGHLVE